VAYGQSKTANILFAAELNRRMVAQGTNISAYSLHPGAIKTELGRDLGFVESTLLAVGATFLFKTIPQGAATTVYLATAPEVEGNTKDLGARFFSDSNVAIPAKWASDPVVAQRLWQLTEELIKGK